MKFFFLLSYGRAGVDLLQSLFDGHKQVSQFPGIFIWPEFYKKIKNINNLEIIANFFVEKQKHFFDSRLNKRERHDKLGKNKDEHYIVDKKIFKENFINLFKSQ